MSASTNDEHDRFNHLVKELLEGKKKKSKFKKLKKKLTRIIPPGIRSLFSRPREDKLKKILDAFLAANQSVRFVQIGSNDGVTWDPIHEYIMQGGWSGVVVEPVPYVFEKLSRNYAGNDRVVCENLAISKKKGMARFWHLRMTEDDLPDWYDKIGSFDRDHLIKHSVLIPNIEEYITMTHVPCLTLPELLTKHGLHGAELIHIDTEGFDLEIIKQINFDEQPPKIILYEDVHMQQADRYECESLLSAKGYRIVHVGIQDTVAIKGEWAQGLS